jgi:prevent-host-death family protein
MIKTYSIAEAKNHLPELIREAEQTGSVQVTRRGKPVAIILSTSEYERLKQRKINFRDAVSAFRRRLDREGIDLNPDDIYADIRDRSAPLEPRE